MASVSAPLTPSITGMSATRTGQRRVPNKNPEVQISAGFDEKISDRRIATLGPGGDRIFVPRSSVVGHDAHFELDIARVSSSRQSDVLLQFTRQRSEAD
jgi:hypothetical protein